MSNGHRPPFLRPEWIQELKGSHDKQRLVRNPDRSPPLNTKTKKRKMPLHDTVGIDVLKASLDAHRRRDGKSATFPNTRAGHRKLIAWIGVGVETVVYESTGPSHRDLEQALLRTDRPATRVNARQAQRFA